MLQIPNMSEEALQFHFEDGLQPWARQERSRGQVDEAIAEFHCFGWAYWNETFSSENSTYSTAYSNPRIERFTVIS